MARSAMRSERRAIQERAVGAEEQYKTRVLTDSALLHAIAEDWAELYEHCTSGTPFQRPEWILSWIDAFSPRHIVCIEVRRENTLVGVAPFLTYPREQERVLAFMGGGVSDYLDLLAAPRCENAVALEIFEAIREIEGWTTFDLTDLPVNSVLLQTELAPFANQHDNCSALELPKTENELLQLLSRRQRANLRNARSRLRRDGEGIFEIATANTLAEFLDDLFKLHASRWSQVGENGVFADERVKTFHRNAVPKLLAKGILRLYRLRLNLRTIAVLYTLTGGTTVFCYSQGFDPQFSFLSPGTQLMFFAIEDALQLGMRKFDFLRGQEGYKQHWRARQEPTYRVQVSREVMNSRRSMRGIAS